jgi:signal peptidase I
VVIAFFICIVVYLFIATPNQVDGPSMQENFQNDDLLLTNRLVQWFSGTEIGDTLGLEYQRGDVIVFQQEGKPPYIKRIIGLAGDRVSVRNGYVYINGQRIEEKYLDPSLRTRGGTYLQEGEEITVPENGFFVMGDNRNNSSDSRDARVGIVDRSNMIGKVIVRYWPLPTFAFIGTGEINFLAE